MNTQLEVPIINIKPLRNLASAERDATDQALGDAAREIGAAVLTGLPEAAVLTIERAAQLNAIFEIPHDEKMTIALNRTDPASNRYWRGYMNRLNDVSMRCTISAEKTQRLVQQISKGTI